MAPAGKATEWSFASMDQSKPDRHFLLQPGGEGTRHSIYGGPRGTAPESTVPQLVQDGLRTDGSNASGYIPQSFRSANLDRTVLIVSFDQDITTAVSGPVQLQYLNIPLIGLHIKSEA